MLTEKDLEKRCSGILSMVFTKGYTLDMNKSVPYRMFFYKGHNALSVSLVEEYVQTGWMHRRVCCIREREGIILKSGCVYDWSDVFEEKYYIYSGNTKVYCSSLDELKTFEDKRNAREQAREEHYYFDGKLSQEKLQNICLRILKRKRALKKFLGNRDIKNDFIEVRGYGCLFIKDARILLCFCENNWKIYNTGWTNE